MIPLCLVTGFLGSGKTTFLKCVVERNADRKLVYLVNEFSPRDVDGALVSDADADVIAVPGGSIFCKCLVGSFMNHLQAIPGSFSSPGSPVEGVVIEASGIADPRVIETMLAETQLDRIYRLATIISIVAPNSFAKLLHTLPNIAAQVEVADHVLLNKLDLCSAEQIEEAEAKVRELNADALLWRTEHAQADVPLFGPADARNLTGDYALCVDPNYDRLFVSFEAPVEPGELTRVLREASADVYRAKGVVPTAEGPRYFDFSVADTTLSEAPEAVPPGVAVIVRGGTRASMVETLSRVPGATVG